MPPTIGLTLGKYAPLHRGHQYVIETALAEVERLIVVVYDSPSTTRIPLGVRAGWIRALYPSAEVIEAWDGPEAMGDTPAIHRLQEHYILERLKIQGVTHFYSSEFYGRHMSQAMGALDRRVDPTRGRFPVSGTAARADPYACRDLIHPLVYRDLVARVVFLGAPSTGKTSLAERLAGEFQTAWMPEYGREYWEQHQLERRLSPAQLVEIAEGHLQREEALLLQSNRFLFCDTNALTTYQFGLYYHGTVELRLAELAAQAAGRYDLVFVCGDEMPYADTWDRSGAANRAVFQRMVLADLAWRKIPYFVLRGSLDERTAAVKAILARFEKYANLLEGYGPG